MRRSLVLIGGAIVLAAILVAAAFFVGKGSVDEHKAEVADLEAKLDDVEGQLDDEETALAYAETEAETVREEKEDAEAELADERGFKGAGAQQVAAQEYETDYPQGAAGRVGEFLFKPTDISEDGDGKWVLTVEAKNMGSSPLDPFCGSAESLLIDAEGNEYSGESLLFKGGANCGESLQPGLTAKYLAEFHLPPNATPVAAYIYGEFQLEEEGKTWELPH